MRRRETTVRAVHAVAVALQDQHRRGTTAYAFAAGVENALGWLLGQVSSEVFRGFAPEMSPLSVAARTGGRP